MGKLYSRRQDEHYAHSNDLLIIMEYLMKRGDVLGTRKEIESAFYKFSEYQGYEWLPVKNSVLASFEEWLNEN